MWENLHDSATSWILAQPARLQPVLHRLHDLVLAAHSGIVVKMRWGMPFYDHHRMMCYLSVSKKGEAELGFCQAREISEAQHYLEQRGRAQVWSFFCSPSEALPEEAIMEMLQKAIEVNTFHAHLKPTSSRKRKA